MSLITPIASATPLTLGAPSAPILGLGAAFVLLFLFVVVYITTRYKRCPSNRVLVVYGKVSGAAGREVHARRRRVCRSAVPGLRLPVS